MIHHGTNVPALPAFPSPTKTFSAFPPDELLGTDRPLPADHRNICHMGIGQTTSTDIFCTHSSRILRLPSLDHDICQTDASARLHSCPSAATGLAEPHFHQLRICVRILNTLVIPEQNVKRICSNYTDRPLHRASFVIRILILDINLKFHSRLKLFPEI